MAVVLDARSRLATARVARLATVAADGSPRLVPCCFTVDGCIAYSAVDDKPKTTLRLRRLDDVVAHPVATLLVDRYDEDWTQLWWVRAGDPPAEVTAADEHERAVRLLRAKYPQYQTHRLDGPVLRIELQHWRSWAAS